MKKILFTATITDHFYYFHLPYLKLFHDMGWEVHVASHGDRKLPDCDVHHEIPIARSPFSKSNINAYKMLKKIIDENNFDIIHCHTPMGGMLTRLAANKKNSGSVIYTAHGFHFYKGAPVLNWLIYYPIELFMSLKTDCLITINEEDFDFAKKHFRHPQVRLVDGVGYNNKKFFPVPYEEKMRLRREKGFPEDRKIIIYVAEMNRNKNQAMLIRALVNIPDAVLLIAGADNFEGKYKLLAKELGVSDRVEFLGHRDDAEQLVKLSDLCAASSLREGLPVNIMEAMACGLPVVAADNRGHRALVTGGKNGFIVSPDDSAEMAEKISQLFSDEKMYRSFSENAGESIKRFSQEKVAVQMSEIYESFQR